MKPPASLRTMQTREMSVLSYANGFTLWHLRAVNHSQAEVRAPGYFNPARDLVANGDMILVSATNGGLTLIVRLNGDQVEVAPCL